MAPLTQAERAARNQRILAEPRAAARELRAAVTSAARARAAEMRAESQARARARPPMDLHAPIDLRDGTVGYPARHPRTDDCWMAAVATCLQVDIAEVPDSRLNARRRNSEPPADIDRSYNEEFIRWLNGLGLRMVLHERVPLRRRRWIGVVQSVHWGKAHCLVMDPAGILFDPTVAVRLDLLAKLCGREGVVMNGSKYRPRDVGSGVSFQKLTRTKRR